MGKITVVGLGPGGQEQMTPKALKAIQEAEVVAGYTTYIRLIEPLLEGKEVIGTGMMQEVDRCRLAVKTAAEGKNTIMVSSGDSGVYGMAGLGEPLMHDFAVISLSDRLTPWELIKKRAALAAQGDFVIALYNPKSKSRAKNIDEIHDILLQYKSPSTPVGIVKNASRADEQKILSNLRDFTKEDIDMFSMVIIGNSKTFIQDGWMVTPRGYKV